MRTSVSSSTACSVTRRSLHARTRSRRRGDSAPRSSTGGGHIRRIGPTPRTTPRGHGGPRNLTRSWHATDAPGTSPDVTTGSLDDLAGERVVNQTSDEVANTVASWIAAESRRAFGDHGSFSIAL